MTSPTQDSTPQAHRGTLVTGGRRLEDHVVVVNGDRITQVVPAAEFEGPAQEHDLILPGLVDVHTHGGFGGDFPSGEREAALTAARFHHRSGTTTLLGSMVTASPADLLRGVGTLADLCDEGELAGIHLEGPFLSEARCGAQDPRFLTDPDPELTRGLQERARGWVRTMTYAPERTGADDLLELLAELGITASLGHTDAAAAEALASLRRAAEILEGSGRRPTVTHLFNGMPPMHHRSPGPVSACLREAAQGRAVVELVADGTHLDPGTVATVFELVGAGNVVLITDAMAAAGFEDGNYTLGPAEVTVAGGVARLSSNGAIAGGTATLLDVVRRTVESGVPLEDAAGSATHVPAAVLGLDDEGGVGRLKPGRRADLLFTTPGLELTGVVRGGKRLED